MAARKISSMPPEDLRRGEDFIEELARRMFGQEGQTKAKVGGYTQYNLPTIVNIFKTWLVQAVVACAAFHLRD